MVSHWPDTQKYRVRSSVKEELFMKSNGIKRTIISASGAGINHELGSGVQADDFLDSSFSLTVD